MADERAKAKFGFNRWIYKQAGGVVMTGPFKGMRLSDKEAWEDGNLGCKILGCYEEELHDTIERYIYDAGFYAIRHEAKIVNIGCAEGYYAVGMKMRMPRATVMACDINDECKKICGEAADFNNVSLVFGLPVAEMFNGPDLVICDCEGDEVNYLNLEFFPGLKKSTIIVECHDSPEVPITKILSQHFEETHRITNIEEGARNPNKYKMLQPFHSLDRWAAVCECRPCMMNWLVMRPK